MLISELDSSRGGNHETGGCASSRICSQNALRWAGVIRLSLSWSWIPLIYVVQKLFDFQFLFFVRTHYLPQMGVPYGPFLDPATRNSTDLAACSLSLPSRRASTTKGCAVGCTQGSA